MDIQQFMKIMMANMPFIVIGLGVIVLIMLGIMINQALKLNYMKKRYRKMMAGVDGANLERMLMGHIDEVRDVVKQVNELSQQCQDNQIVLNKCLQKVGVVRFSAFEGVGSDLSYAIALLDENNNGFV